MLRITQRVLSTFASGKIGPSRKANVDEVNVVSWVSEQQISNTVQLEPVLVLLCTSLFAWGFYKVFLKNVSLERHDIFKNSFRNLGGHIGVGLLLYAVYVLVSTFYEETLWGKIILPYVGLFAVIFGCIIAVKTLRIVAYQYLFLTSMRAGVPMLLVNIFTLILSLAMFGWLMSRFFEVDLTPLLATSAILSVVLGLALQDTLGNLFTGVALQIDKSYELGDWIEVKGGSDKIVGQVYEVSWRSTVLLSFTEELITIPNRYLAQSQIYNFSIRKRPFFRSHIFRLKFGSSVEEAKKILVDSARLTPGILSIPEPVVLVMETTDSWVTLKMIYGISDYGSQFGVADQYLTKAINNLHSSGIALAANRISLEK